MTESDVLPRVRREERKEKRREIVVVPRVSGSGDDGGGIGVEERTIKNNEPATWADIVRVVGARFPCEKAPRRTRSQAVALYAQVCEDHGWRLDETWTDAAGELRAKLSKEEA